MSCFSQNQNLDYLFFFHKKQLVTSIFAISVLFTLLSKFYHTISSTFFGLFLKISLSSESSSAVARSSSWLNNTLYYLNESDLFSLIFGSGPGHVSHLAETDILQGSTNWYLDILIGFGFLGLTIYITLLLLIFSRSLNLIPPFRFWYTVSLFSVHIHLFTNTGFYFPPWHFYYHSLFYQHYPTLNMSPGFYHYCCYSWQTNSFPLTTGY